MAFSTPTLPAKTITSATEARALLEPMANLPVPFTGSRETLVEVYEELGEDELAKGMAVFRDMKAGSQEEIPMEGLTEQLLGRFESGVPFLRDEGSEQPALLPSSTAVSGRRCC